MLCIKHGLSLLALGCVLSAQAQSHLNVVLEVTPTSAGLERAGTFGETDPVPLTGEKAKPFLLHYSIDLDSLQANSAALSTQPKTPWTDTVLPYASPFGPWKLNGGFATIGPTGPFTGGPSIQTADMVSLHTVDGYDTMGMINYSPSWLFYERAVYLPGGSQPDTPWPVINKKAIVDWFTAKEGRTFENAYDEVIYRNGGTATSFVRGDVHVMDVSAVPEASVLAMLGAGLATLACAGMKRRQSMSR